MNNVTMLITQYLNLDMSCRFEILFNVYRRIAERELRLLLSSGQRSEQFVAIANDAHPAAAAASRSFDDNRVTNRGSDPKRFLFIVDHAVEARREWNAHGF